MSLGDNPSVAFGRAAGTTAQVLALARDWGALYRHVLFAVILLVMWITTKPFGGLLPGEVEADGGNIVNQLTFAALALAAIVAVAFTDLRILRPLLQPSYALLLIWLFVGVAVSAEQADAIRALAFTLITMLLAGSIFALPSHAERFRALLLACIATVIACAWAGAILLPDLAIHTDDDPAEPEHAGSWRGHFIHKNIAGAMMAIFAIFGVYALRSRRWVLGVGVVIGSIAFLYLTRSKTSFMLLPPVLVIGLLVEWLRNPFLRAGLLLGPVAVLNTLTLGSALSPAIAAFNREWLRDPSFTGRFDIWRFGFEKLAERPWTGFGFESFWKSEAIKRMESKLELGWLVQNIVHGHNGYLDVALGLGLPGLALVVWIFLVKPVWDYQKTKPTRENQLLATAFITVWLFISLCMCLEVFYLRRSDPIWFALVFVVFGLRMTASHRMSPHAGR